MEHFERFLIEMEREYDEDSFGEHILAMFQDPRVINYIDPFPDDIQGVELDSKHPVPVHLEQHSTDSDEVLLSR